MQVCGRERAGAAFRGPTTDAKQPGETAALVRRSAAVTLYSATTAMLLPQPTQPLFPPVIAIAQGGNLRITHISQFLRVRVRCTATATDATAMLPRTRHTRQSRGSCRTPSRSLPYLHAVACSSHSSSFLSRQPLFRKWRSLPVRRAPSAQVLVVAISALPHCARHITQL